jgi:hypothetical protein
LHFFRFDWATILLEYDPLTAIDFGTWCMSHLWSPVCLVSDDGALRLMLYQSYYKHHCAEKQMVVEPMPLTFDKNAGLGWMETINIKHDVWLIDGHELQDVSLWSSHFLWYSCCSKISLFVRWSNLWLMFFNKFYQL